MKYILQYRRGRLWRTAKTYREPLWELHQCLKILDRVASINRRIEFRLKIKPDGGFILPTLLQMRDGSPPTH
jgi:hypothetical protein